MIRIEFENVRMDYEKELERCNDSLLDWFAEEVLIQPDSKLTEMYKALKNVI